MERPEKVIKMRATEEEIEILEKAAGGKNRVSNYIRDLIRADLMQRVDMELPTGVFERRRLGNTTKGENRRGKENRLQTVEATQAA